VPLFEIRFILTGKADKRQVSTVVRVQCLIHSPSLTPTPTVRQRRREQAAPCVALLSSSVQVETHMHSTVCPPSPLAFVWGTGGRVLARRGCDGHAKKDGHPEGSTQRIPPCVPLAIFPFMQAEGYWPAEAVMDMLRKIDSLTNVRAEPEASPAQADSQGVVLPASEYTTV